MFAVVEIIPFENTGEPDSMAKTHQIGAGDSPLPVQSDRSLARKGDNPAATETHWWKLRKHCPNLKVTFLQEFVLTWKWCYRRHRDCSQNCSQKCIGSEWFDSGKLRRTWVPNRRKRWKIIFSAHPSEVSDRETTVKYWTPRVEEKTQKRERAHVRKHYEAGRVPQQ